MKLNAKFDLSQKIWLITCKYGSYCKETWSVAGSGHIGEIKIVIRNHGILYDDDYLSPTTQEVVYGLREAKPAFHLYQDETNLFASEEEAQNTCDKRNKENNETNE